MVLTRDSTYLIFAGNANLYYNDETTDTERWRAALWAINLNNNNSWFFTTTESNYEYSSENDCPYIDNIVYVACAHDWCTWAGMFYFSMRKSD